MRFAALLLIGLATATAAEAQAGAARVAFLPIPNTLPALLFAPDPLSGTLLHPLIEPAPDSTAFAEVPPEPVVVPIAASTLLPDDTTATVAPTPAPDAAAAPPAGIEAQPAEPIPAPAAPPAAEAPPPRPAPAEGTITVIVENVQSASGNVNVAICDKALSKEGCPYVHEIPAQQGFVETEFKDIPPGKYAVVGYHDVNGNNQFDKMLGIPREPYALSNNAGDKLVPTFADAALAIKAGDNAVIIRLKRLGG